MIAFGSNLVSSNLNHQNKSFSIRSSIVRPFESIPNRLVHLTESYSSEQHRARIDYKIESFERFYYDTNTRSSLVFIKSRCFAKVKQEFHTQIYGIDGAQMQQVMNLFDDIHSYLIGPAGLLFGLVAKAKELNANSTRNEQTKEHEIIINLELPDGKALTAYLYYDNHSDDLLESNERFRISLLFLESSKLLVLRFYNSNPLSGSYIQSDQFEDLSEMIAETTNDLFAYPVGVGCSQFVSDSGVFRGYSLYNQVDHQSIRFSFKARIDEKSTGSFSDHSVSYDGASKLMRVDIEHRSNKHQIQGLATSKIFDFSQNRKYLFASQDLKSDSDQKCFILPITSSQLSQKFRSMRLSDLLLGTGQFTYLGRAQLRGINARVYEALNSDQPMFFADPLLFLDEQKNETMLRTFGLRPSQSMLTLVYLAESPEVRLYDSPGQKLLLLKVFDATSRPYTTTAVAHINNFQWNIQRPNSGSSVGDLFNLQELCSQRNRKSHQLELLLEPDSQDDYQKPKFDWIDNWLILDDVLASKIRGLQLQAVMIYDIHSRLIKSAYKLMMETKLKLAEHPKLVHSFKRLATSKILLDEQHLWALSANSPSGCLWLNPDPSQSFVVHFCQSAAVCIVNSTSNTIGKKVDGRFYARLSRSSSIETYLVESEVDEHVNKYNEWLRSSSFQHLEDTKIVLNDPQSKSDETKLQMIIKKVKHNHFDAASEGKSPNEVLDGFGFSGNFSNLATNQQVMSEEQCKTACDAQLSCNSYSYCRRSEGAECRLSKVHFRESVISRMIDKLLSPKLPRGTIIQLGAENVQLIRDLTCSVHLKSHLEMFEEAQMEVVELKQLQVIPVDSQENCASICFSRTLNVIREADKFRSKIDELSKSSSDHVELEETRKQHQMSKSEVCDIFWFLDSPATVQEEQNLSKLANKDKLSQLESYCFLKQSRSEDAKVDSRGLKVKVKVFKFDFSSLYEKKSRFMLVKSALKPNESEALSAVQNRPEEATSDQFAILRSALAKGKNFQLMLLEMLSNCARQCFMQSTQLWPLCSSFDLATDTKYSANHHPSICYLNSKSVDLQVESHSSSVYRPPLSFVHYWHFEPRFDLSKLEESENFLEALFEQPVAVQDFAQFVGLTLLVVTGIFSGLLLGVLTGMRLKLESFAESKVDTIQLVSS